MTATLDKAGRIVLPKKLREKLHLKPGAKFNIEVVGERIEMEEEVPKPRVVRKGSVRVIMGWEGFDAVKAIKEMREEREEKLAGPFRKA
jgi:AbrB family looped-hinge helix DNA binding protein